jgi:hypothetical protein
MTNKKLTFKDFAENIRVELCVDVYGYTSIEKLRAEYMYVCSSLFIAFQFT